MLVIASTINRLGATVVGFSARTYLPTYAVPLYSNEVTKIKLNSCSFLPPLVAYSITIP